jgi:uncharacterized membrane protein
MSRWLYASLVLTGLAFGASLYVYANRSELLEQKVPTHWGIDGQPDKFTPRDRILLPLMMLPGAMTLVVAMTIVLPWISPRQFGVEEFRGTFDYLMTLVVGLMAYMDAVMLTSFVHSDLVGDGTLDVSRLFVAGIFPFFALLGNQLGKVRRNFWMGVRTPWTLASEAVWTQTHRLAAWTFVAVGVAGFVATLANVPLILCIALLAFGGLIPAVYSLLLYKRLEREGRL